MYRGFRVLYRKKLEERHTLEDPPRKGWDVLGLLFNFLSFWVMFDRMSRYTTTTCPGSLTSSRVWKLFHQHHDEWHFAVVGEHQFQQRQVLLLPAGHGVRASSKMMGALPTHRRAEEEDFLLFFFLSIYVQEWTLAMEKGRRVPQHFVNPKRPHLLHTHTVGRPWPFFFLFTVNHCLLVERRNLLLSKKIAHTLMTDLIRTGCEEGSAQLHQVRLESGGQ